MTTRTTKGLKYKTILTYKRVKMDMAIFDMCECQKDLLIEWVIDIYPDGSKMLQNQLYQLKVKFVKWKNLGVAGRAGAFDEGFRPTADHFHWEGILQNCMLIEVIRDLDTNV